MRDPILLTLGIANLVIGAITLARNPNWFSAVAIYIGAALIAFSLPGGC